MNKSDVAIIVLGVVALGVMLLIPTMIRLLSGKP